MAPIRPLNVFLAKVVPWPTRDLPGFVNIHYSGKNFQGYPGRPFTNDNAASRYIFGMKQGVSTQAPAAENLRRDLYICMSLQREDAPSATNPTRRVAKRLVENAVALKSLWGDVDIKPNEATGFAGYPFDPSQEPMSTAALQAFTAWRIKIGLPKPTFIVASGSGGFHFHYVFDAPVLPAQWEPLMRALINAGQKEGFAFDYGRNALNQIMRLPETFNHKTNPPKDVVLVHPDVVAGELPVEYPFQFIDQILTPYKVAATYAPRVTPVSSRQISSNLGRPSPVFAGVPLPGRLDAGIDTYVPTIDEVATACPFIKTTLAIGGANYSEDLWRQSLRVAAFVKDPEQAADRLSKGYTGNTLAETLNKLGEIEKNKDRVGWPQCQKIHDEGGVDCKTCPHLPQGRSPLNFVKPVAKAVVAAAVAASIATASPIYVPPTTQWLPEPYKHAPSKHIFKKEIDPKSDDGREKTTFVHALPIAAVRAFKGHKESGREPRIEIDFMYGTEARTVRLDYSEFVDHHNFQKRLAAQDVPTMPVFATNLKEFLVAFTDKLHAASHRVRFDTEPYGWSIRDGKEDAFGYARLRCNGAGETPMRSPDQLIDTMYHPTGDPAVWPRACKLITDLGRPELNAIVASSAGACLMQLLGYPGLILHPYGESGSQKSAAMEVAQAVWASASEIPQLNETDNRVNQMLGYLKNLPYYFDELTADNRDLVALAMSISGGRTKGRLKRSSELMETMTYSTMLICASNHPIHSVIEDNQRTTTAGMNRVFEWEVPILDMKKLSTISRTDAQAILAGLNHNYGHTGLIFARYFGANIDAIRTRVLKCSDAVDKAVQGSNYDRFWIAGVACLIVAAQIGVEQKVWEMDVDQLCGFLVKTLMHLQGRRDASSTNLTKAENAERYLSEYIAAHTHQMLVTNRIQRRRGPVPQGFIKTIKMPDHGRPITIRAAQDDQLVRISLRDFGAWLKRDGLHRGEIVDAILKRVPGVTRDKMSLIVGTGNKGASREDALEIDLTRLPPDWFTFN